MNYTNVFAGTVTMYCTIIDVRTLKWAWKGLYRSLQSYIPSGGFRGELSPLTFPDCRGSLDVWAQGTRRIPVTVPLNLLLHLLSLWYLPPFAEGFLELYCLPGQIHSYHSVFSSLITTVLLYGYVFSANRLRDGVFEEKGVIVFAGGHR